MKRKSPAHASLVQAIEAVARLSIWIPVALTVYFFVRVFHLPYAVGPALMALMLFAQYLVVRIGRRADAMSKPLDTVAPEEQRGDVLLAVAVLVVALAPAIRVAWLLGGGSYPSAFLNADESYNFMIAQALVQGFPPPDLTYQGRVTAYHLGGPMLAEMVNRYGLASLHLAFYGLWPIVLKCVAACAIFTILGRLVPGLSTQKKLIGVLVTSGLFMIDFYNVLWNIRTLLKTGLLNAETVLEGMPVFAVYNGFVADELNYAAPLAAVLSLVLIANLDRRNILILACGLFGIFAAKSSVFVPIGAAWGLFAFYQLIRYREHRYLAAGIVALALCLLARPYMMESRMATLALGSGYGLDWLAARGINVTKALGGEGLVLAAAAGLALLLIGSHVFGWSIVSLVKERAVRKVELPADPLLFIALSVVVAALFSVFFVLVIEPSALAGFFAIHSGIKEYLWRPLDTYIYESGKMSIGEARIVVAYGFALVGTAAVLRMTMTTKSGLGKLAVWAAIACSIGATLVQSYRVAFGPPPAQMKVVTSSTAQALAVIPVVGSVILTNECAYDRKVELHMPLMNAAMSAVYGHQFWACNFMFGNNFAAPDAPERLDRIKWFWREKIGGDHYRFLLDNSISHLLWQKDSTLGKASPTMLDSVPWIQKEYENEAFLVYKVR